MKEGHESVFSQTKVKDLENVGWLGNLFIRHNISSAPRADSGHGCAVTLSAFRGPPWTKSKTGAAEQLFRDLSLFDK